MNFWCIFGVIFCGTVASVNADVKVIDGEDPGSCDSSNHAEELLIRDRENKERIVICTESDGVYKWRTIDGVSPLGELFNPGYDCSDILDKQEEAKDGFYWIQFDGSVPKKVWCDMTTDGGGFMLIGRKNNSITWTVPSDDYPVEPFGYPHWSSALGDAPIFDFRVQMATSEDFKDTKAHWSFRLQTKRPLKNLMVTNQGGCDRNSAGIGHIAYVKDLQTERIVTTNLRCSKFGFGHHPLTNFGWNMMNSCLKSPCTWGFAFHHLVPVQTDYSGSFSYSATGSVSGIDYNATASIGCDKGHCCGCFGPVGGTDNYCSHDCYPINGGTISTNVFTWFWVRSTLPKRVWKKCMEYTVMKDNGEVKWYKLLGGSAVPTEGRCSKNNNLLYDGIAVVLDASAVEKIPPASGLLAYRKDNKELYLRANKTWNVIAQEKKVDSLNLKLGDLKDTFQEDQEKQDKNLSSLYVKLNQLEKLYEELNKSMSDWPCTQVQNKQVYCDATSGWILVARFSNADGKNWMDISGDWWYDKSTSSGATLNPGANDDMISEAFWNAIGHEIKITRSDDSSHTPLLQTTSSCLGGKTFRSKITSYGNFRNGAVWSYDTCLGNCRVQYGGQYTSTAGFEMYSCSSDIQSSNYIGFWCDWDSGDGAVMMIGGGGSACGRADHGIGITEENEARFGQPNGAGDHDFGYENGGNIPSSYSLNLWLR